MERVCVYLGSSPGRDPAYTQAAEALGAELIARGLGLVYGGGRVGLMGSLADAVMRAGGSVTGIIPEGVLEREVAHRELTELHVVRSMHERKALMADKADAFIALPGGLGTLEELAEVLTWSQLGLHAKPIGLLDVAGFWRPFVGWLDSCVEARFVRPEHRALLLDATDPAALLDALAAWTSPGVTKWLDRDET